MRASGPPWAKFRFLQKSNGKIGKSIDLYSPAVYTNNMDVEEILLVFAYVRNSKSRSLSRAGFFIDKVCLTSLKY